MAESQTKDKSAAEKAYANAADQKVSESVNVKAVGEAVEADKAEPAKADKVADAVAAKVHAPVPSKAAPAAPKPAVAAKAKPAARKAAPVKPAAKKKAKAAPAKSAVKKIAARTTAPKPGAVNPVAPKSAPIKTDKVKENTMATMNEQIADKTKTVANDMQSRMTAAYEKGTEMTSEAVEFQKGNVEAMVESSRIFVSGMQDMGRTYVEEARSAAETMQDDVKKMAAIKSPTELFQLQGEIARRNFDAMVATASKNTEAMIKLANEAFAPVSNRMSLAAEKVAKAA